MAIAILPMDHGDMDHDLTEWTNLGARHVIAGPYLGDGATNDTDWEQDGQRTADASGDDSTTAGVDDENGLLITDWWGNPTTSLIQGESSQFQVTVNVPAGREALLYAWIDWNGDGNFVDLVGTETQDGTDYQWNEYLVQGDLITASGTVTIDVYVPRQDDAGNYIDIDSVNLRLRVVDAADGWTPDVGTTAYSGEVEDYVLNLLDVDYGDMAESVNSVQYDVTTWAEDGARHVMGGTISRYGSGCRKRRCGRKSC